jgi:hypothetical protein
MQPALWTLRCQVDVYLAAPGSFLAAFSSTYPLLQFLAAT